MLSKSKKLSKKEIKEDKLVTQYYNAIEFYEANKNTLLTIAAAIVGLKLSHKTTFEH